MPVTWWDTPNLTAIHLSMPSFQMHYFHAQAFAFSRKSHKIRLSVGLSLMFSATLTQIIWVWLVRFAEGGERFIWGTGKKERRKKRIGCRWASQSCMTGELLHCLKNESRFFFLLSAALEWILPFWWFVIYSEMNTYKTFANCYILLFLHQWYAVCTIWRFKNCNMNQSLYL